MSKQRKSIIHQTLLGECKYEPKNIKMENLINDDLEKSCPIIKKKINDYESNE